MLGIVALQDDQMLTMSLHKTHFKGEARANTEPFVGRQVSGIFMVRE